MDGQYKDLEEYDKLKTKILKFVIYKKRTEEEVRQKFITYNENFVEKIIEFLKENGYINDELYVERYIKEIKVLKTLSYKEVRYKLQAKGIDLNLLSTYEDELKEYEIESAQKIYDKKIRTMDEQEVVEYLLNKGYRYSTISKIEKNDSVN